MDLRVAAAYLRPSVQHFMNMVCNTFADVLLGM